MTLEPINRDQLTETFAQDHVFLFTSHRMNLVTNSATLHDSKVHAIAAQKFLNEQDGPLCGVGGDIIGEFAQTRNVMTQN